MKRIRYILIMLWALYSVPANAQVSVNIGLPHVSIGINLPVYPELVVVPGYPVYYAPQLEANFFFYDGVYWIYQDDNWYESSWYNGPWVLVDPVFVPVFILRIPVRYFRRPPAYFYGWRIDAPPRWGDHWGHDWERHRKGWDKWNHGVRHKPAPLPLYQRQYSGESYPRQVEQQHELHRRNYRYQPRDPVVRQRQQGPTNATPQQERQESQIRRQQPQPGKMQREQPRQGSQERKDGQSNREIRQKGREIRQKNGDVQPAPKRGEERERGRGRE
ncbi:MAG: hypothetical protein WAW02_01850 [Sideroxyarcus sp.]